MVLGLVLCWPVVSSLAAPGGGGVEGRPVVAVIAQHRKLADLGVKAANVMLQSGVLTGTATVGNVGAHRAPSSTAGVAWKSADSGGTIQIGRFRVSALAPSQQDKAHFRVAVPKGASGSYVVSVCADVLGQVRELSKKNNCRKAGTVTIRPGSGVKGYGPTGPEQPPSSPPPGGTTPPAGTGPAPVSSPPDTVIDSGPTGIIGASSATFTFHGSDADDTFQCSLDGAPWAVCTSPQQYISLADGPHTFQVRTVNAAGEVDATPASASFTVEAIPPQITITSAPHGRIPIGLVSISFSADEAGSTFKCSLDGGVFTPCSTPYEVASPAAGPHTFTVEATNQAGVTGAASHLASWSSVEPQHDLCGTIASNVTIGPDYAARYVITCSVDVSASVTLTAQPDTVIKADNGTNLSVQGLLDVAGTSASPVVFTSINDNSAGGTTGTGKPAAGDWQGVVVSGAGSVAMTSSVVKYAATGLEGTTSGSVSVIDGQWGEFSYGGLAVSAGAVTVRGSTVLDSGNRPAFSVFSENLNLDQLTGNSATGGLPAFFVSGTVSTSSTWHSEGAPGLLGPPGCGAGLTVASGVTVTVEAGAVIKGGTTNYIGNCGGPGGALTVLGTLDVAGTSASPVVFTSINDNSAGGTTGTGKPAAGDWQGIIATPSSTENPVVMLEHASVSYATTGLDATTNRQVTVQSDSLAHNGVAVDIAATIGTNAAIHETWFDENGVALAGSSDWNPVATPVTSCEFRLSCTGCR
ncbi:MAG: hypothetical protein H0X28_11665 [Solirubrobacterales bacterium]|nr:hypothetical protein [Solirubrobacterales bacterium]